MIAQSAVLSALDDVNERKMDMPEQWRFYMANVNDALASIFVDLDAKTSAPDPKLPTLLWVWLRFKTPTPNGMPAHDEGDTLYAIEESIRTAIINQLGAQQVGNITTQGRREFYFYSSDSTGFQETVATAMNRFPTYEVAHGTKPDPEWSQYLDVLYPNEDQLNSIENLLVLANLKKNGDSLTNPRPIEHFAYFPTESHAGQFAAQVKDLGYQILPRTTAPNSEDANPFGVVFERTEVPSLEIIDAATKQLKQLAAAAGGVYDGWETQVIREADGKGALNRLAKLFKRNG